MTKHGVTLLDTVFEQVTHITFVLALVLNVTI